MDYSGDGRKIHSVGEIRGRGVDADIRLVAGVLETSGVPSSFLYIPMACREHYLHSCYYTH